MRKKKPLVSSVISHWLWGFNE